MTAAFASPLPVARCRGYALPHRPATARPSVPVVARTRRALCACASRDERRDEPALFVDTSGPFDLDSVSLREPLTPDERAAVLRSLPRPIARFLIRRADEALSGDEVGGAIGDSGRAAQLRRQRARQWLRAKKGAGGVDGEGKEEGAMDEDDWYREYVRDEIDDGTMDEYGRAVDQSVYAPTPRVDGADRPLEGEVAVFAGGPADAPEQAQTLAYGVLSFIVAAIAFKILFAFLQFFVSFTFSFFAIFALSAGIFVFFFLLKF